MNTENKRAAAPSPVAQPQKTPCDCGREQAMYRAHWPWGATSLACNECLLEFEQNCQTIDAHEDRIASEGGFSGGHCPRPNLEPLNTESAPVPVTAAAQVAQDEREAVLPAFPTMLRKMWSGGEVQQWINENIKPQIRAATPAQDKPAGSQDKQDAVDAAMLDWLATQASATIHHPVDMPNTISESKSYLIVDYAGDHLGSGATLRAAIRAAMQAHGAKE